MVSKRVSNVRARLYLRISFDDNVSPLKIFILNNFIEGDTYALITNKTDIHYVFMYMKNGPLAS